MQVKIIRYSVIVIAISICAAIVTGCGSSKTNNDAKVADSLEKGPTVLGNPERALDSLVSITNPTAQNIMTGLYNDYDAKSKTSGWLCSNFDKLSKFKVSGYRKFTSQLLFADSVTSRGIKQLYIIISSRPDGDDYTCHACAPIEEVFIFEKQETKWRLTYRKIFDNIGSEGVAPKFALQKLGPDNYAFIAAPGGTGQGLTTENLMMYSYYQGDFNNILTVQDVAGDNSGECDAKVAGSCWSYNYTLTVANKPASYNDILLNKKGTENRDGKVMPLDTTINFQFAGNKYSPAQ
jgi:hypothetical protein